MGKRKVTLDTNILISALGWKGNPHRILEKVIDGEFELFISYEQFEELSRVLGYPRFEFTAEQKIKFKELILEIATFVRTPTKLALIKEDPSDNRILECALVANVDFIISGDEHTDPFPSMHNFMVMVNLSTFREYEIDGKPIHMRSPPTGYEGIKKKKSPRKTAQDR